MNTLKHILIPFIMLFICIHTIKAQDFPVILDLTIPPPPEHELDKYLSYEFNIVMTVTNTNMMDSMYLFFDATLTGSNGLIISSINDVAPPDTLALAPGETKVLTGEDFSDLYMGFTEDDVNISGITQSQQQDLITTRLLPEGDYQFCMVAVDAFNGEPQSMQEPFGCANFQIEYPDRPIITSPFEDELIPENESQILNFSWLASGSASPEVVLRTEYEIKVIDITVYDGMSPTEAMLDPAVDFVYSEIGIEGNFHMADIPDLEPGHRYAVRVTATDTEGIIQYLFDGHSEVVTFRYGEEGDAEYYDLDPPLLSAPINGFTNIPGEILDYVWTPSNFAEFGLNPTVSYKVGIVQKNNFLPAITEHNVQTVDFQYLTTDFDNHNNLPNSIHDYNGAISLQEGKSYHACVFINMPENDWIQPFPNDGWGNCVSFNYGEPEIPLTTPVLTYPLDQSTLEPRPDGILEPFSFTWTPSNIGQDMLDIPHQYKIGIVEHDYNVPNDINLSNINSVSFNWLESVTGYSYEQTNSLETLGNNYYEFDKGKQYTACIRMHASTGGTELPDIQNDGWGNCVTFNVGDPDVKIPAPHITYPISGATMQEEEIVEFKWNPAGLAAMGYDPEHRYSIGFIEKTPQLVSISHDIKDDLDFEWMSTEYLNVQSIPNKMETTSTVLNYMHAGKEYHACIRVINNDDETSASIMPEYENGGWGNCITFSMQNANVAGEDIVTPPVILLPEENGVVENTGQNQFKWDLTKINGISPPNVKSILAFIDETDHNLDKIKTIEEFTSHKNKQSVLGFENSKKDWTIGDYDDAEAIGGLNLRFMDGHSYSILVKCMVGDETVEEGKVSQLVHFTYSGISSPEIITPEDNTVVHFDEKPNFTWALPNDNGTPIDNVKSVIAFIDLTANNIEKINTVEEWVANQSYQSVVGLDNNRTEWNVDDLNVVKSGKPLEFKQGHKFVMLLMCPIGNQNINHALKSKYVHFTVGNTVDVITTDCSAGVNFKFNPYYPLQGDTIPFNKFPIIAQYDPVCTDVNRLGFNFNVQETNNASNSYSRNEVMNKWPTGPIQYLKDLGIADAAPLRASLMPLNLQSTQDGGSAVGGLDIKRGSDYKYTVPTPTAKLRYSSPELEDWFEDGFDDVSFNVGMPMPILQSPAHLDTIPAGKVNLKWKTGNTPNRILPPIALVHAEHSNIVEKTYFSAVYEKYVLQVSKDKEVFTDQSIIFGTHGQIAYNGHVQGANSHPNNSTYNFDLDALSSAVYKDMEIETEEINAEGDYYWRVLWMNTESVTDEELANNKSASLLDKAYRISPIRKFVIGEKVGGEETKNEETDCTTNCEKTLTNLSPTNNIASSLTTFTAGYFAVNEVKITHQTNGKITGTGEVTLDFLNEIKIKVKFMNIRLNSAGQLVDGLVLTQKEDTPFNLEDINNSIANGDRPEGMDGQVNSWLDENSGDGRIITNIPTDDALALPIGFEKDIKEHTLLIGITEITFGPTEAKVKILYEQHFEKMRTDQWLSLAAEICIKPSGFGAEVLVHMNKDLVIEDYWEDDPEARDIKYIIKGTSNADPAMIRDSSTYIEFKCACVESFALRMEAEFDENKLVKDTESGDPGVGPVKAYFNFTLRRESACNDDAEQDTPDFVQDKLKANNFMVDFTMDPFQIKGLEGWAFHVDKGYLDLSSLENPVNMTFPDGYEHAAFSPPSSATGSDANALANTWTGFYLKEVSIKAPTDFYENSADRGLTAGVRDLIIDNTGFSGGIFAENIIAFGDGEVDDCSFSIEKFQLTIIQNAFQAGKLEGKFGIPITDEETKYEAVLAYTIPDGEPDSDPSTEGSSEPGFISEGDESAKPESEWGFFMSIRPEGRINTPAFMGNISLKPNSYVHVKYGEVPKQFVTDQDYVEERKGFALYFDGVMDFSTAESESSTLRTDTAKVNAPFSFKGMQFDLGYNNKDGFDWNHSFASPQKYLGGDAYGNLTDEDEEGISGFPITISQLDVISKFGDGRCIGAMLTFKLSLNLMDDDDGGFEASADLGIGAAYDYEKKRFAFDGLDVTCITVGGKTSSSEEEDGTENAGITFKGKVCFLNDAPYCGVNNVTGVAGKLEVGLPVATVHLAAMFASTEGYRFWYVDGKAVANSGKIAQIGALDLIGLSGGIYYNMKLENGGTENSKGYNTSLVSTASALHDASPSNDECVSNSGFRAIPDEGSYIFKLGLAIATAGDHSVFNMDVGVTAAMERGRGLTYFSVVGDGYIMADVDERDKAPIKADIIILFEKQLDRKIFHAGFAVYVDLEKEPLELRGVTPDVQSFNGKRSLFVDAGFHLEAPNVGDNTWSFKLGKPREPGGLSADIAGFLKIKIRSYFQVGNDIDEGFMALPELITDLLGMPSEGDNENGLKDGQALASADDSEREFGNDVGVSEGKGFILGLSAETEIDISVFIIYAHLKLALGFDINVLKYGADSVCYTEDGETISPIGSNGWYASGQLYAGILGEVGLQVWFFGLRRFHLFRLGAAFLVRGGFPNPVWAEGRAAIMYSVLGGMIDGTASINFTVGDKCIPPKTDPFGFSIINGVDPEQGAKNVSPFVHPKVSFNIPIDRVFEVPAYEDILDEDGHIVDTKVYTEKFKPYIEKLEIKDKSSGQLLDMETRTRSFSEDNTIMTAHIRDPQANKHLSLHIKLAAQQLIDGNWDRVVWPQGSGKTGYWSEDSTVTFTTTELPEKIPDDMVKNGNPIRSQRYFLKDSPLSKNGKIEFFRNLRSGYFQDQIEGEAVEYVVKFFDMDGAEPFVVPIKKFSKSISFDIPVGLKNDMIYNMQVVRRKPIEPSGPTIAGLNLKDDVELQAYNPNDPLINTQTNLQGYLKEKYHFEFDDLFLKMDFISKARKLIPGESAQNPDETVLLSYPFKTSKFNTLQEKLTGADSELKWIEGGAGDLTSMEPWVELSTEEGFDHFDLYGFTSRAYGREYHRLALVAFYPDLNTEYWNTKAKPIYLAMSTFMKHKFSLYPKEISIPARGNYTMFSTIDKPLFVLISSPSRYIDFPYAKGQLSPRELNMQFDYFDISKPKISRFKTIDPRTVSLPLGHDEVQHAWDQTVTEMADEMFGDEEESNAESNSDEVFITGITSGIGIGNEVAGGSGGGIGLFGQEEELPTIEGMEDIDFRRKTRFLYDFHRKVASDVGIFKTRLQAMHYFNATFDYVFPGSNVGTTMHFGNIQRDHMKEQFPNYDLLFYLWNMKHPINYSLENNPGTYKFNVNYYMLEINGHSVPAWGSPNINLNFTN